MKDDNILDSGQFRKDPRRGDIRWEPIKIDWDIGNVRMGAQSQKIVHTDDKAIKITGATIQYIATWIFVAVGIFALYVGIAGPFFLAIVIGVLLTLFGFSIIDYFTIPVYFDKRVGRCWKGRRSVFQFVFGKKEPFSVEIEDIKAVQLLFQHERPTFSFQINVVLTNHTRINIVEYDHQDLAIKDATYLARFLGVEFLNGGGRVGM